MKTLFICTAGLRKENHCGQIWWEQDEHFRKRKEELTGACQMIFRGGGGRRGRTLASNWPHPGPLPRFASGSKIQLWTVMNRWTTRVEKGARGGRPEGWQRAPRYVVYEVCAGNLRRDKVQWALRPQAVTRGITVIVRRSRFALRCPSALLPRALKNIDILFAVWRKGMVWAFEFRLHRSNIASRLQRNFLAWHFCISHFHVVCWIHTHQNQVLLVPSHWWCTISLM